MPERGLENYSSPILRCAVFRRLFPGAQIDYSVVPIGAAFPLGHTSYEGKATEAVKCEIVFFDGTYIVAFKEIDKIERGRTVDQTPENLAKNETKALGRALRDAGIPQRLDELRTLMTWISSLGGTPTIHTIKNMAGDVTQIVEDVFPGTTEEPEGDDSPDAGAEDPTPEQILAKRFAMLDGPKKAAVVKYAREELSVSNVLRAGEHADALLAYLAVAAFDGWDGSPNPDVITEHDRKNTERRAEAAQSVEEPF